ncbi:MAG: DUF362 domain-containing protein [Phycisphaerales bacterium]|nr:MAG: DUF362 domain-containing protein [Phycisphaerales bacterium]
MTIAALGLLLAVGLGGYLSWAESYRGPVLTPRADYRAQVFYAPQCPQDPAGDRFLGLDDLLVLMGREGFKFYESPLTTEISGPDGIIGTDDVVILKINYQWPERGGTNTDLLRGLIRRIVDHPDRFTGEIVVCENSQREFDYNFNRVTNNAQDVTQSPHDVVVDFAAMSHDVSHFSWRQIRYRRVSEFDQGDMVNGYVVYPYNGDIHGRVSYPKFQTDFGTYISVRYGLWDPQTETYDRDRLKFINIPVLKAHGASYGATACVKHYMGVVTRELNTYSHIAIEYGILGTLIGEIGRPDLNILDAIWINADPEDGPWCSIDDATRRDMLVAGVDPVAIDMWAVTNILIPAFIEEGHSPPWPDPSADPTDPDGLFRIYLDNSMYQILAAGYDATNDLNQVDLFTWTGGHGDFGNDGNVDGADQTQFESCFTGPGGGPIGGDCAPADFDADTDVDCDDWTRFLHAWTESVAPTPPAQCPCLLAAAPEPVIPIVPTNRYLSIAGGNAGMQTALRVTLGGLPEPYDIFDGTPIWVGEPNEICENAGQSAPPVGGCGPAPGLDSRSIMVATLQCEPHYTDWSVYDRIYAYGEAIVPGAAYSTRAICQGCDINQAIAYSAPLTLQTSVWGDAVSDCTVTPCGPPDGSVDVTTDVTALLDKFKNLAGAPRKARCDLEPAIADRLVNITDVMEALDAFRGFQYPFEISPPCGNASRILSQMCIE